MMMMGDSLALGVDGGPVSPMNYKRALLRSPPREFTVEILPPLKYGNNWSYGLKVCPIIRLKRSSDTRSVSSHSSSTSSYSEYEIWRKWEDCLDFQETLEAEYGKMSRQKVKVLRRGAAGKRKEGDGPYTLHNAAASFESLPEGPDPREVAVNVHDLIPPLTRKGTLFKVSKNTVKQRGEEFAAMFQALFNASEDAPVLLQELRNCTPVRDFFGFWRRDKDLQKKTGKDSGLFHSNQSLSSLPTTPSSPAFSTFSTTMSPGHNMHLRPRVTSDSSRDTNSIPSTPTSAPSDTCAFTLGFPHVSNSFASMQRERLNAGGGMSENSIMFTDELLLEDDFGMNAEHEPRGGRITPVSTPSSPQLWGPGAMRSPTHITPSSDPCVPDKIPETDLPRPQPRTRRGSCVAPERRNARIFLSTPHTLPPHPEELMQSNIKSVDIHAAHARPTSPPPSINLTHHPSNVTPSPTSSHSAFPSSRTSSISMTRFSIASSITSYIQSFSKRSSSCHDLRKSFESDASLELDLPFVDSPPVPHKPPSECDVPNSARPRDSFASFASGRTDSSAEAVIPRYMRMPLAGDPQSYPPPAFHDGRRAPIIEGRDMLRPGVEDDEDSIKIESCFDPSTGPELTMEVPENEFPHLASHQSKCSIGSIGSTGSLGDSPTQFSHDAFAVKALYRDSVVVFRAQRSTPLAVIRQRIQDRFTSHESVPLEKDFVLAYLPSRSPVMKAGVMVRKGRSNSATSSTTDLSQLRLLQSELDWQSATITCGGKVTLRVLDQEAPS